MNGLDAPTLRPPAGLAGNTARSPAVPAAVAFIVGILGHARLPHLPLLWVGLLATTLVAAVLWFRRGGLCSALLTIALATGGVAAAQLYAFQYPRDHVSAFATEGTRLAELELRVDQPPRVLSMPFAPHRALPPKQVTAATVTRVRTRAGWVEASGAVLVQVTQPHPRLAVGQTVRVLGMLQRPAPASNPGQMDWARYYRDQRVLASVQVPHAANIEILSDPGPSALARLREGVRRHLAVGFPAGRSLDHALLRALLLGDSDPELRDVQDDFKRTGTSHHLAISGMHVAVLGGVVLLLCRAACLRPRRAVIAMTAFVLLYGAVALPSPPVVRSVLLCVTFGAGLVLRRSIDPLQLLAVSVMGMLAYKPVDLYDPGFQLSFGTVLGLMLLTKPLLAWMEGGRDPDALALRRLGVRPGGRWATLKDWLDRAFFTALAAGVVAWLVSFPLIAFHFEQLNPWAIPAGIVLALFVFASLVAGLFKVALSALWPGLSGAWAWVAATPVSWMRGVVDWLATWPAADVPLPPPPIWLMAAWYALLLSALHPCPRPGLRWGLHAARGLAALAILVLPFHTGAPARNVPPGGGGSAAGGVALAAAAPASTGGALRVTLLAVGAGQCAVVEPPSGRTVLLDAGSSSLSDLRLKCLGPFLRHRGRTGVDTLAISHANYDHFSAAAEVAAAYDVHQVLVAGSFARDAAGNPAADALLAALADAQRPPRVVAPGDVSPLGRDTAMEVLWPPRDTALEGNDASMVLRLTHAGKVILFTGDIQGAAMEGLMKELPPEKLRADVLVAPHHGSYESQTPAFVAAVGPKFVVSSNDRTLTNKQRTFDALAAGVGVPLYRTHRCGAITIVIDAEGDLRVHTFLPVDVKAR